MPKGPRSLDIFEVEMPTGPAADGHFARGKQRGRPAVDISPMKMPTGPPSEAIFGRTLDWAGCHCLHAGQGLETASGYNPGTERRS